jgi:dTDP-glucose 4,6-dehydratase
MNVFVTGGLGFIGSNFVFAHLKKHPADTVVILDNYSYAANSNNILGLHEDYRVILLRCDIRNINRLDQLYYDYDPKITYHFAAESHVDNSIAGDDHFISTNVEGTHNILKCIKKFGGKLVHVSTDEVYGSLGPNDPGFTETTPYDPRNPYSATKAASDHLVRAYVNTHGIEAVVTNCSNNYGPRQHSEKFIPTVLRNLKYGTPIPVYGNGVNVRDWLFVEDHCAALLTIAENFKSGARYNIGGGYECSNLDLVYLIIELSGVKKYSINFIEDRKGHDLRYSMNSDKLKKELGWEPKTNINDGLIKTLEWYNNA